MSNRLVIFDLDGVLVDSRDMHYDTLNAALVAHGHAPIPRDLHVSTYDGLPTSKKLDMLGITGEEAATVWRSKQSATMSAISKIARDSDLVELFLKIRDKGCTIAVVSNATKLTTQMTLSRLGVLDLVWFIGCPDEETRPKPYPELYWRAMKACDATAATTLIIEDSPIGRRAAIESGATLLTVESRKDLTPDYVLPHLPTMYAAPAQPWIQKTLRVLIPMAGGGTRFRDAGYTFPKPLVEVNGKPMIQVVVENLNLKNVEFIFVVQRAEYEKYHLKYLFNLIAPGCQIVLLDGLTEGAAKTTLAAEHLFDDDRPLLIANSDQFLDWDVNSVLYAFNQQDCNAGIVTFPATHPKWSYVRLGEDGFVAEVAEKQVISGSATAGVYFWKHGSEYAEYAHRMINKDVRTNGEFYVAPVFNEAIADGFKVRVKNCDRMWGLGTPEDLRVFLDAHKE